MNIHPEKHRPVGVAHLIFGLVFTGIAAIWLIGKANDTDVPDLTFSLPAVLIGAGLIGLAASVLNQRRTKARLAAATTATTVATTADTTDPTRTTDTTTSPEVLGTTAVIETHEDPA